MLSFFTFFARPLVSSEVRSLVVPRAVRALDAIAWSNLSYDRTCQYDCDDYAQTVVVLVSLAQRRGWNHRFFVRALRTDGLVPWGEERLPPGEIPHDHKTGQITKLLKSGNPKYLAEDGITDGAAMRTLGLALRYGSDPWKLAEIVDASSRVTHSEIEARATAVLVTERMSQILYRPGTLEDLIQQTMASFAHLNYGERGEFLLKVLNRAVTCMTDSPEETLRGLLKEVGLLHLAFSAPVSAVVFPFVGTRKDKRLLEQMEDLYAIPVGEDSLDGAFLSDEVHQEYVHYQEEIGQLESHDRDYMRHGEQVSDKPTRMDTDTFFSIAFSMIAAQGPFLTPEAE